MTEQKQPRPSKALRGIAVTLMGLTLALTLLGGVGTTCVALGAEKYPSMAALVPYKPLYQAFVVVSLAVGIRGISVMVSLVRGGATAYRNALWVLLIGAASAGIQMAVSQSLRGASAPVNVRFYVTAFTLAVFLILRLPPLRGRVDFTQPSAGGSGTASAGTALFACGIITLTTPLWAGPSHVSPGGANWIGILDAPLKIGGGAMALAGLVLLAVALRPHRESGALQAGRASGR